MILVFYAYDLMTLLLVALITKILWEKSTLLNFILAPCQKIFRIMENAMRGVWDTIAEILDPLEEFGTQWVVCEIKWGGDCLL